MHHIYTTPAVVIDSYDSKDSNKTYRLVTQEFGVVTATAQSVREEKSKMRYALQPLSYVTVSLVLGKVGWRITGAVSVDEFASLCKHPDVYARLRNMLSLIQKVAPEQERERIFDMLVGALGAFRTGGILPQHIEALFVGRMVYVLGYIVKTEHNTEILENDTFDVGISDEQYMHLLEDINTALVNTDLV
jgi:DNA repair protein RecO